MSLRTLARVGRISNLPTVWSNCLAAAVFACAATGGECLQTTYTPLIVAIAGSSLLYIAGMFLNDAFDYQWDRQHNHNRPLVNREIAVSTVWSIGVLSMLTAICLVWWLGNPQATLASLFIAAVIVLYNATHKQHPSAALLMGLARYGVYLFTALLMTTASAPVFFIAAVILPYITGLTLLARQEHNNRIQYAFASLLLFAPVPVTLIFGYTHILYWATVAVFQITTVRTLRRYLLTGTPDVRKGIGGLLASIPLVDSMVAASTNSFVAVAICLVLYIITPVLHKYVAGT